MDNDEKGASKSHYSETRLQNHILFSETKMAKLDAIYLTKMAKARNPLGPYIPI